MGATKRHMDPLAYVRPEILRLPGYEAVEAVELIAAKLGLSPDRIAKLDGNENPYGPSPKALEALATLRGYNIYPDPDQTALRAALSRHLGVGPEYLIASAGSDELIQLFASAFLGPGDAVIDLVPTFGMYAFETGIAGGRSVDVARRSDFTVDVAAVAERIDATTKLIFATSPNNPTGNMLAADELEGLLALGLPVVVDEAYIEFAGAPSLAQRVPREANLIVLRTFSKWAGLAGLRVGYAVMHPALAECLFRIRQPYSVSVPAEAAAIASLEDAATLMERVAAIVAQRERLHSELAAIPFLRPHRSRGNFILCDVLKGDARAIRDRLREHGVFVRYFSRVPLQNCIRISVGLPRHTDQTLAALRAVGATLSL